MEIVNFSLIGLYFLIVLGIGFWLRKHETTEEFVIGGRKLGTWEIAFSILAVVGGLEMVSQAALTFDVGLASMWFWIGIALGLFLLAAVAPKIKALAAEYKFVTISDYFFLKFDKKAGTITALVLFVAFFALLVGQLIAGASLLGPLLNIDYATSVIILAAVTLAYLVLGGFRAVTKTDLIQGVIMLFVFALLLFSIDLESYSVSGITLGGLGSFGTLSFLVIGVFAIFAGADIWQRVFAARDVATVRKGFSLGAVFLILFGLATTLVGFAAKNNFPDINPEEALFFGFFDLIPEQLFAFGIIVVIAAIMSAIDTQLFVLSSSVAKDFIGRRKGRLSDEEIRPLITKLLPFIALAGTLVAIFISDILLVFFGLLSLILCVSPSVVGSLYWKLKSDAVFISVLGGVVSLVILAFMGNFTPENSAITLPVAAFLLILGQFLLKE